ncbi:hypothetical protein JCM10450v2_001048 [Rhodotorula kratochvilovae]
MTVPLPALAISLDATPAEQLVQLARIKRAVVGTRAAKAAVIRAVGLESLVALLDPRPGPDLDGFLAVGAEAATVLAALSIPTLDSVSTLLASGAHHAVALSLPRVLALVSSSTPPLANAPKLYEAHLRALKALYTDLVRVVGPREWGTEVIGASIDAAERRDAESLWAYEAPQNAPASGAGSGKGKAKETGADMAPVDEGSPDKAKQVQAAAERVLREVYEAKSEAPVPFVGSSAAAAGSPASDSRTATLTALLDLLIDSAQAERTPAPRIAELVCAFFAGTVRWPSQRAAVLSGEKGGATLAALKTLVEKGSDKVRESALKALAVLIRDSPHSVVALLGLDSKSGTVGIHPFASLVQSPIPSIRLAAATLCAVISKTLYPLRRGPSQPQEIGAAPATALLGLIEKEPTLRAQAAFAFAYLVADDLELQKRAVAARCLQIFAEVLKQPSLQDHPYPTMAVAEEDARVREGLFLCVATIAALSEPHRRLVLDQYLLSYILFGLSYPTVGVRAAACHCVRALSRSVNVLRTDLVEAHAEEQLVRLLREDENEVVKITAVAAVANLLLDFSPMRPVLVEAGCIPRMCQLITKSSNPALQLNAMWAIKNATYQSTAEFKRGVLSSLTWADLAALIAAPDPAIAELALAILRNLTCVTNNEAISGLGAHEMGEERLLGLLQDRIAVGVAAGGRAGGESLVEQALYCLNNIATASESAQLAIASRTTLLRYIFSYLDSRLLRLRVAALWVLHNLAFRSRPSAFAPSPGGMRRPHEIVDKLRAMGLDAKLRVLERDPELDVRERVRDLKEALM